MARSRRRQVLSTTIAMSANSSEPPEFGLLHALLFRDVATDKAEVKRLLHRHREHLLRTLERSPSADREGGAPIAPRGRLLDRLEGDAAVAEPLLREKTKKEVRAYVRACVQERACVGTGACAE